MFFNVFFQWVRLILLMEFFGFVVDVLMDFFFFLMCFMDFVIVSLVYFSVDFEIFFLGQANLR